MIPFIVLVISVLLLRAIGAAGVGLLNSWIWCLRGGLALMFLLTASAHWGKQRGDLIAMVPRVFPRPDLMVSATGVFEILGAVGLLIPTIAPVAAACLATPRSNKYNDQKGADWLYHQMGNGGPYSHIMTPNKMNCIYNDGMHTDHGAIGASSRHSGGVNALFMDGAVRFCKDSISQTTWWSIATRAGGEVIDGSSL